MLGGSRTSQFLPASPAVEDHLVSGLPFGIGRGLDRAGEIDSRNHRKAAHHRNLAGDRQAILVIERRPFDPDGDVTLHQIALIEIGEAGFRPGLGLLDHDRLERRHMVLPRWT